MEADEAFKTVVAAITASVHEDEAAYKAVAGHLGDALGEDGKLLFGAAVTVAAGLVGDVANGYHRSPEEVLRYLGIRASMGESPGEAG